jgi:glyoxylate/hydroxypyruvate reductase A
MVEWVVLQVLLHFRQQPLYDAQKLRAEWKPHRQPAAPEVRVGIMGMGVLGQAVLEGLRPFGFNMAGWARTARGDHGIPMFTGREELSDFLRRTDILISLLPLTEETRGLLAAPLFGHLARDGALGGPVLINAGRGGLQVEADVDAALRTGVLKAASIDVFEVEPLPATNPLWKTPNLIITPHNSAPSAPFELVPVILAALEDHEAGRPLRNVVNRTAAY